MISIYKNHFLIIIFSLSLLFLSGCDKSSDSSFYKVEKKDFEKYNPFVGEMISRDTHNVQAPFYSKITWMVPEGTYVDSGEVVAEMDTDEISVSFEQDELALEIAEIDLELFDTGTEYRRFSKEKNVLMSKLRYEKAQKDYNEAKFGRDTDEIIKIEMQIKINEDSRKRIEKILSEYKSFLKDGYVSEDDYNSYEKELKKNKLENKRLKERLSLLKQGKSQIEIEEYYLKMLSLKNSYNTYVKELEAFDDLNIKKRESYLKDIESSREKVAFNNEKLKSSKVRASQSGVYIYESQWRETGKEKIRTGFSVNEGDNIGSISPLNNMQLEIYINEFEMKGIKKDNKVIFSLDSEPDKFYRAQISEISNIADNIESDALNITKIKLLADVNEDSKDFKPGMTVSGKIIRNSVKNSIVIPLSTIKDGSVCLKNGKEYKVNILKTNYQEASIDNPELLGKFIKDNQNKSIVKSLEKEKIKVVKGDIKVLIDDTGLLESIQREIITAPGRGKITEIKEEGASVEEGDLVVQIDTEEYNKELDKLKLDLNVSKGENKIFENSRDNELFKLEQDIKNKEIDFKIAEINYNNAVNPPKKYKKENLEIDIEVSKLQLEIIENEIKNQSELNKKGFIADEKIEKLREQYNSKNIDYVLTERENTKKIKNAAPDSIWSLKRAYDIAKLELDIAYKKYDNVKKEYTYKIQKNNIEMQRLENRKKSLENIISNMTLKSPVSGVVVYVKRYTNTGMAKIKQGDEVWTGSTICLVSRVDDFIIKGKVSETEYLSLEKGQKVVFKLPGFEEEYEAQVKEIGSFAEDYQGSSEDESKVFEVVMDVNSKSSKFQPGMSVNYSIVTASSQKSLIIPRESVYADSKGEYVFMKDNSKRYVETGTTNYEKVEVLKGLKEGDIILGSDIKDERGEKNESS